MRANRKTILAGVGIVAGGVILYGYNAGWFTKGPRYKFFPKKDSAGSDIRQMPGLKGDVDALRRACDQTEGCVAFNTEGYLKSDVRPRSEWDEYPEKTGGLYVKKDKL